MKKINLIDKKRIMALKRKNLINLAIDLGDMNPTEVSELLHVDRSYVYKVIGKRE